MKRPLLPVIFALTILLSVAPSLAQQGNLPPADPNCSPLGTSHLISQTYPTNGLEPEFPVWCYTQPQAGSPTRILAGERWIDTWDNTGPAIQTLNDGDYNYRVFDTFISSPLNFKAGKFINTDHWMIDLADISSFRLSGGVMVSPDKQFRFENGALIVEVDAAAGGDGMGGSARFYEIDVSPAPAPTNHTVDALYGYGQFGYVGAVGCRIERNDQGGNFVCAMYDDSGRATDGRCVGPDPCTNPLGPVGGDGQAGRVWETQGVGNALAGTVIGNDTNFLVPGGNGLRLRDVWRQCGVNEHDLHCRDRFRMELRKDSITLYVNGYMGMRIDLTSRNSEGRDARIPDSWFASGVRPYFTSWVNGGQHTPVRWHWNEVRVNPGEPPSASPSFCLGVETPRNTCPHGHTPGQPEVGATVASPTATPPATSTALPTATATPTPTASPTPAATPTATATATPSPVPTSTPTPTPTATAEALRFTCTLAVTVTGENVALGAQECVRTP